MKMMWKKTGVLLSGTAALMLWTGTALAHPGHGLHVHMHGNMFMAGVWHPLTGFDHLLVMLAVGLWSALTHHTLRQAILTPISFLVLLFVGAMMGMAGVRLPGVEPMIMASLLVLGLLVASRTVLRGWVSYALIGFFALFHGLAHGMELPYNGNAMTFVAGFMATTFALHLIGLFAGFQLKRYNKWIPGALGAGVAAYGAILFVGM